MKKFLVFVVVVVQTFVCIAQDFKADLKADLGDSLFYEAKRHELYGRMDSAYLYYQKSLEAKPESPATLYNLAIGNLYYTSNDSITHKYLSKAIALAPDNYWYRETLATLYMKQGKTQEAIRVLEEIHEKFPKKTDVLPMLGSLYSSIDDYDNALRILDAIELHEGENDQLSAQKLRLMRDSRMHKLADAVKDVDTTAIFNTCQDAIDHEVHEPVFYYYKGLVLYQRHSYSDALAAFQGLLAHQKRDTRMDMIVDSYSIIGDIYHQLGDDRNAFLAYDTCLLYRPEEPSVLNNYAYYLSLRRQNLDRAAEMSLLSMKNDSLNATYIDTYAWILFQQNRYTDAKTTIDKAIAILMQDSLTAHDANVIEHAGDIYSKCQLTAEALAYWQQALNLDSENQAIIQKKIKKKRYVTK